MNTRKVTVTTHMQGFGTRMDHPTFLVDGRWSPKNIRRQIELEFGKQPDDRPHDYVLDAKDRSINWVGRANLRTHSKLYPYRPMPLGWVGSTSNFLQFLAYRFSRIWRD